MASKPFISARIPEDLLERLESYSESSGESKSGILIDALTEYLDASEPNKPKNSNEEIKKIAKELRQFEIRVLDRLLSLEDRVQLVEGKGYANATLVEKDVRQLEQEPSQRRQLKPQSPKRLMGSSILESSNVLEV